MNEPNPILSVCIPTFNSAEYIKDAIESILTQTFNNFELIIVDNNSTDNTEEIVKTFHDERISYYKNALNYGALENLNKCLTYAKGNFIKFLCADDVLLKYTIEKQYQALNDLKNVGIVTCDIIVTDRYLNEEARFNYFPGLAKGKDVADSCLNNLSNYIGGPSSIMIRKDIIGETKFDFNHKCVGDLKFSIELLLKSNVDYFNIDIPGCLYRRHNKTDTLTACTKTNQSNDFYNLLSEFNAFTHLNCGMLLTKPINHKKKFKLLKWLLKNIFSVRLFYKSFSTYIHGRKLGIQK